MRNRPIFVKVKKYVDKQGLTIEQIRDLHKYQVRDSLKLSYAENREYLIFKDGIKKLLIADILTIQRKQQMNEMMDKLLLSSASISQDEANLAVERIFEERDLKKVSM